jgi:hypothetical protein
MGRISELHMRLIDLINASIESGVELKDLDNAINNNLRSPHEFYFYLENKESLLNELGVYDEDDEGDEWTDPAGGIHHGDEDDPAAMYESQWKGFSLPDLLKQQVKFKKGLLYYREKIKGDHPGIERDKKEYKEIWADYKELLQAIKDIKHKVNETLVKGGSNQERSIDLQGPQGNAFYILGMANKLTKQLKEADPERYNWEKINAEMTSGNYNNLVHTFEKYFGDYVTIYGADVLDNDEEIDESINEMTGRPGRPTKAESDPEHDLATTFKTWRNHKKPKEYAEILFGILIDRHPNYNENVLKNMAYKWLGLESPKKHSMPEFSYVVEDAYTMKSLYEDKDGYGGDEDYGQMILIKHANTIIEDKWLNISDLTNLSINIAIDDALHSYIKTEILPHNKYLAYFLKSHKRMIFKIIKMIIQIKYEDESEKRWTRKDFAKYDVDTTDIPDEFIEDEDEIDESKNVNEGRYDYSEAAPGDDLRANFRSWEDMEHVGPSDAEELFNILQIRHPDFNEDELRLNAYHWVGLEAPGEREYQIPHEEKDDEDEDEYGYMGESDESYLMNPLDEGCNCTKKNRPKTIIRRPSKTISKKPIRKKLHEEQDYSHANPTNMYLKDVLDEIGKNFDKSSKTLFGWQNEGGTYIIYKTIKGMIDGYNAQEAFNAACEMENYHGNRKDVVEDRKKIAKVLYDHFDIKVNHVFESQDEEFLMKPLNEVDYDYLAKMGHDERNPRYIGGYKEYHNPTGPKTPNKPKFYYSERKEGFKHIARKHQILKDMGYDLETDEEDPTKAPTKRELKRIPNKRSTNNKFNRLKGEYYRTQRDMDKLHKRHIKTATHESLHEYSKYWFNNRKAWEQAVSKLSISDDDVNMAKDENGITIARWYEDREDGWIRKSELSNI